MLSLLYQPKTATLRMRFDDEGRDELLLCLRIAIKERDHDFLVTDLCEVNEGSLSTEWEPRDFINIVCLPEDTAPLSVEEGIEIKGGAIALSALAAQLQAPGSCLTLP